MTNTTSNDKNPKNPLRFIGLLLFLSFPLYVLFILPKPPGNDRYPWITLIFELLSVGGYFSFIFLSFFLNKSLAQRIFYSLLAIPLLLGALLLILQLGIFAMEKGYINGYSFQNTPSTVQV